MFGTLDRQLADRVVLDHLRDARKRLAELAKNELPLGIHDYLHVHEAP